MKKDKDEIRKLVTDSYNWVKSKGYVKEGQCIDASVGMHLYLTNHGIDAKLKRYETPYEGGHWTIGTPVGEFDPTISEWEVEQKRDFLGHPQGSKRGKLYRVGLKSPHKRWDEDNDVDEKLAYDCTDNEWEKESIPVKNRRGRNNRRKGKR